MNARVHDIIVIAITMMSSCALVTCYEDNLKLAYAEEFTNDYIHYCFYRIRAWLLITNNYAHCIVPIST